MENKTIEGNEFAIFILTTEKSQWDKIAYEADKSIQKNGANAFDCNSHDYAKQKSNLLKSAIDILNAQNK